ncbi:hypothetical protein ONZ45_g16933 [Pleurotus djamor]|nr:hypothetical protein ONZ45_g16933 [Pleurotus djamor]
MPIHIKPSKTRAPDPSLVILLGNIHSLALPSLIASIELRNLIWTAMDPNLQHALFSLISSDFIKDVTLYGCEIPYGVPCLRFVGPQTTSLTLEGVSNSGNRSSLSDVTPMEDIPLSSAPNLTTLTIRNWGSSTYSSSEWIAHGVRSSTSWTTALRNCSWHNNVKTLSLRSQADAPALFNFVRTFQGLTTFKFAPVYPEARTVPFPFHEVLSLPTLEYLHILSLPSSSIVWLTNSFKPSTLQFPSPYHTNLENLKIIHIDMRYAWRCTALIQWNLFAAIQHHPLPDLLRDIQVFDDVVASIPGVECYLKITLLNIRPGNGPEMIEYEEAKKTLVDLQADLKALKLQVVY